MSSPIIVPSLPAGYDVLQPALATKVRASPRSLSLLGMCCVSNSLLTSSLQWINVLDSCAEGPFKFCSHAAWIVFTPRFPETVHMFLSHLGRRWNSVDYIGNDVACGRLLCFVPSDRRVVVTRK